MEINELIASIFQVCILPLLGILTTYFIQWVKAKMAEMKANTENLMYQKYIDMLDDTIVNCVAATNQTYVESLKAQNAFDLEAQKEAFRLTSEAVLKILNEEAQEYLSAAVGDLTTYITQKIEAEVKLNKIVPLG